MKQFGFDEFLEFVKWEYERIATRAKFETRREDILAGTVKLAEEVGELSNEVLRRLALVRAEKIKDTDVDIEKEWADCVIVLFLLAHRIGFEPHNALTKKIAILKNRKY